MYWEQIVKNLFNLDYQPEYEAPLRDDLQLNHPWERSTAKFGFNGYNFDAPIFHSQHTIGHMLNIMKYTGQGDKRKTAQTNAL